MSLGGLYMEGLIFRILRYPTTHTKGYTYLYRVAQIRKYLLLGGNTPKINFPRS